MEKKLFVLLAVILLLFSSCGKDEANKVTFRPELFVENTNPSFERNERFAPLSTIDETDYSNIIAYTEQEKYSVDSEVIFYTVVNNNVGKGFYVFQTPFIERKENGEWVRLNYQSPTLNNKLWLYCAIEGNTTIPNSTRLAFRPEFLISEFTIGAYRLVVFAGDQIRYAEFRVE